MGQVRNNEASLKSYIWGIFCSDPMCYEAADWKGRFIVQPP